MKLMTDSGLRKALTNFLDKLKTMFAAKTDVYTKATTDAKLANKADKGHTHDDKYYTESEVDSLLQTKSNTSHNHDTKYFRVDLPTITSGDFNNYYTEQGVHNVSSSTTITNAPYTGGIYGLLTVTERSSGDIRQRFVDCNHKEFTRTRNGTNGSWSAWVKVFSSVQKPTWSDIDGKPSSFNPANHTHDDRYYTESEINSKVSTLQSNIDAKAPTGHLHDTIYLNVNKGKVTDFNANLTAGMYYVSSTSNVTNAPLTGALYGTLEVIPVGGGSNLIQRFTSSANRVFIRYYDGSKFNAWAETFGDGNKPSWDKISGKPSVFAPAPHTHDDKYYTEAEINTKISTINDSIATKAAASHLHDSRYPRIDLPLISSGDFNNYYTSNGTYTVSSTATIANAPLSGGLNGILTVFIRTSGNVIQRFTEQAGKEFIRHRSTNGVWTSWCKVFSTGQLPSWNEISGKPSTFAPSAHTHDDRYYTESEINSKIATLQNNIDSKSPANHLHDTNYMNMYKGKVTDFNTALIPGMYYASSSANVANAPITGAIYGTLEVLPLGSGGYVFQRFLSNNNKIFTRYYDAGTKAFTNWVGVFGSANKPLWTEIENKPSTFTPAAHSHDDKYYTEAEINTKISAINDSIATKAASNHNHDTRYFRTAVETLGNGADFNTRYNYPGVYNVSATSNTNGPYSGAIYGTLIVYVRSVGDVTQVFISHDNKEFIRHRDGNSHAWSAWAKVFTSMQKPTWGDIEGKPSSFTPATHHHDERYYTEGEVDNKLATKTNRISAPSGVALKVINEPVVVAGSVSTHTGPIKITMPKSWTNTMMSFDIVLYDYKTNGGKSVMSVSGYNYTPTDSANKRWVNPQVNYNGAPTTTTVRFGHDGTKCCVLLGDNKTVWNYPRVFIKDLMVSNNSTDGWDTGWTVSFVKDETGITDLIWAANTTTNSHHHDNRYLRTSGEQITSGDFNNYYKENAVYSVSSSTTISNAPYNDNGLYGVLTVVVRNNGGDAIQSFIDCYGKEFVRHRSGAVSEWKPWVKVYSSSQKPKWTDIDGKPSTFAPSTHKHEGIGDNAGSLTMYAHKGNEINFGGNTSGNTTMYFGYSPIDNRPVPTHYVFGKDASAEVKAKEFYAGGTNKVYHAGNKPTWNDVTGKPSTFPAASHHHDDRYYTESEVNNKLAAKADTGHTHNYLPPGVTITKSGDDFYLNW